MGSPQRAAAAQWTSGHQHGEICQSTLLLNPFCPLTAAKVLALKATVIVLLTLLGPEPQSFLSAQLPTALEQWHRLIR